jgi:sensor c-di-GMP phosphodiesterase-like protein
MVRAILSLAGELGINVVAEGVETDTQRKLLVQASAQTQGQGFLYSRAVPADETMPMLRTGIVTPEEERKQATAEAPQELSEAGKRAAAS